MRKPLAFVALAVLAGVLAATVFREEVAYAAQAVNATIVGPLDGGGNIKVHEQGTASVNVTNSSLSVAPLPATATRHVIVSVTGAPGDITKTSSFPPIAASLITLYFDGAEGLVVVQSGGADVLSYPFRVGPIVLPMSQPLTVDAVKIICASPCSAFFDAVGR